MTFQIILISVLGVGIGFLTYFIIKSIIAPKRIDGIQKLLKQGKNSAAVKLAKQIIAKDPRDFEAHYYLGKAYLADNRPELALMEYKTVNQNAIFDGRFSETEFRNQSAMLYSKFNLPEEALKEYLLLTKLEPTNPENFYNAARIFEQRDKTDQALGYYSQAIKLNRKHAKAHAARGLLLYRAKQFADAKKEIDYSIQLSPDTFSSYFYLGKILKEGKDYAGAVTAFEKSARDPQYKQKSFLEKGTCYIAANAQEKAIAEFEKAIKASTDEASQETLYARYFLATCYERMRKIDLALQQWEKIYLKNKAFKDVPAKLAEYRDLQENDSMKEFLTCSSENFIEICKKIALNGFNLSAKDASTTKYGCKIIATEAKSDNWMSVRQQLFVLLFFREPDLIEDAVLRELLEEMKKQSYGKGIICTSAGFTRSALTFAENRPFELIAKDRLEQLLSKVEM